MRKRFLEFLFVAALLLWLAVIGAYIHSRNHKGGVWAAAGGWSVMISWDKGGPMMFVFCDWPKNLDFGWASAPPDGHTIPNLGQGHFQGQVMAFDQHSRYWDFIPISGRLFLQLDRFDTSVSGHLVPRALVRMWGLMIMNWWLPLLSLAGLPASVLLAILYRIRRRRNRLHNKLCLKCGYDLRATPDRCPECGTIPPAAKGATT